MLIINDTTFHSADPWNEKSGTIDLEAGEKYDIRFEMFDGGGGAVARLRWSAPSLSKETIPQSRLFLPVYAGVPDAPTGLAATNVGAYAIDLAWTPGTSDQIGYRILRSPTGAAGSFVEVAQVAANSYRDEVLPGKTYYYQVVAFNLAGDSAPSETFSVTNPASTLPVFWRPSDVGSPGQTGTAAYDLVTSTFTIEGGGADIWGDADQFYYVYQTMTGDGTITVRVVSQEDTDPWAKAGLMIRETLDAGSRQALVAVTPGNGLTFQGRDWPYGWSFDEIDTGGGTPCYLRLTRRGDVFTAYTSSDGITFTQLGNPRTISMGSSVLVGLAVTAHNDSTLGTTVFDNVSVVSGRVITRYEYDRDSRLTFTVEDDGDTSRTVYDGAGRIIKTIDPEDNTVEYAYDRNSNLIESRQTDVAQVAGVPDEVFLTTCYYDSLDRLQRKVDNLGGTSEYRYDSRNNLVATADAQGPLSGATTERRAFAGGTLTAIALNSPGNVTLRFYDGQSRLVREETILTASGSGDGIHIGATLEGTKTDPPPPDPAQGGGDGIIRTGRSYDDNSLPSAEIDDDGNVTLFLYDNLNRRVAETKGLTTASGLLDKLAILGPRQIVTPTVLMLDNPAYISADKINAQLAGAKGRLAEVASLFPPLAGRVDDNPPTTIVYGYDQNGNLLLLEDENDTEVFGRFDAVNRRIATRIFRSGQTDSFPGDLVFAPNPVSDPSNPSTAFPPVIGTTKQDFQYDGLSRLTWATDNNDPADAADDSTVTRAYDSLGRVIEEAQRIGLLSPEVVSSAWRAGNLRSALTYPNGRVVRFTYDALDRLDTVTDQGAPAAIADYDWIGTDRVLRRSSPLTGTRMTYLDDTGAIDIGYDSLGRTVQLRDLRSDGSLIVGFTYTYDRMGNKLTEGKLHDPANSEVYAYDSAYRLVSFDRPNPGAIAPLQSDWVLDGAGNWDQVDGETREHSSINEITERTAGGTTTPVLSDDNGNEIDDGTFTFEWDFRNRLRRATRKSDGQVVGVYSYDPLDRRIRTVVTMSPSVTTDFYHDGRQEIENRSGADDVTQQYVYGVYIDEPLVLDLNEDGDDSATGPGDFRLAYHQNALFSVYALTDTSAVIKEGYLYDAYGRQTVFQHGPNGVVNWGGDDWITPGGHSGPGNPYMFTGRRLDAETGLYYYRNRYYNAVQGRFISRDRLGFQPYPTEMTGMDLAPGGLPLMPGRRPQPQAPEPPRAAPPSEPLPRALVPPNPLPSPYRKFPFIGDPGFWALPPENYRELPGFWALPPEHDYDLPGFWALPDPRWDSGPNLYEYGRSNPGTYVDPYGKESIGLQVGKLVLELPSVKEKTEELKQWAIGFGQETWGSMSPLLKGLTIAGGAAAAYEYYDTGRPISTGNIGFGFSLLGIDFRFDLSITLQKVEGKGPTLSGSAGLFGSFPF